MTVGQRVRLVTVDELARAVQDVRGVARPLFYRDRLAVAAWAVRVAGCGDAHELGLWVPVDVSVEMLATELVVAGGLSEARRWVLG